MKKYRLLSIILLYTISLTCLGLLSSISAWAEDRYDNVSFDNEGLFNIDDAGDAGDAAILGVTQVLPVETMLTQYEAPNTISSGNSQAYSFGLETGAILGIRFTVSSEDNYIFRIAGNKGTALEIIKSGNELSDSSYGIIADSVPANCEYTVLLDVITQKYSLWTGAEKVACLLPALPDIPTVKEMIFEQTSGTGTVSDFSVFYPVVPSDDAVELDCAYLTFDKISYQSQDNVTTDLRLITKGRAGSDITWSSSDTGIIDTDGRVNSAGNASVTLTAEITNGSETPRSKTFNVNVAEWEKSPKPKVLDLILEENFDNNVISSTWKLNPQGGAAYVANEGMMLIRTENVLEQTMADLYANNSLAAVKGGVYALEYTLTRKAKDRVLVYPYGPGLFLSTQWHANGKINHAPGGAAEIADTGTTSDSVKFTIIFNTTNSTYSLLVDDKIIAKEKTARTPGQGITYIRYYLELNNFNEVKIDNIRLYETEIFDEDKVRLDYAELVEQMLINNNDTAYQFGMVSKDLTLITKGPNGSDISWASSNENLISSDGRVTLAEDENDTVTLTATIYAGEYSQTKDFTFKVLKNVSDLEAAQLDADALTYAIVSPHEGNDESGLEEHKIIASADGHWSSSAWTFTRQTLYINPNQAVNQGRRAYLKFDLSEVRANVAAGAVIESAYVTVTQGGRIGSNGSAAVSADSYLALYYIEDDSWGESAGTPPPALTREQLGEPVSNAVTILAGTGAAAPHPKHILNVTQALNDELAKPGDNFISFEAGGREGIGNGNAYEIFSRRSSKDFGKPTDYAPTLIVNYEKQEEPEPEFKEIKRSLNFLSAGIHGSTITWQSSNTRYITESGRVIRPRYYEEDANVTVTATIRRGSQAITKDFNFIVLKDDEWSDPSYIEGSEFMTDAEFFGVWNGTSWVTKGKLDYGYPGLEAVEEAVKANDIPLAKERLLAYFANRTPKTQLKLTSRNTAWANAFVDDFYSLHTASYYQGEILIGNEWGTYSAPIHLDNITRGGYSTFTLRAWYNEASFAEIKRHNDPNAAFRPRIELVVNGSPRTYYATDSIGIRAGNFKSVNYNGSETVTVQTYGNFLDDNTRHGVFKFAFTDLDNSDVITSAKLILYTKASPAFSGKKRLIIIGRESSTWNGETANWNSFVGSVYSYNGLPDGNSWTKPEGADDEFLWQSSRFQSSAYAAVIEYLVTNDDSYMYKTLRILNNYLIQTRNYKTTGRYGQVNPAGMRGSFVRTLDAALKNNNIVNILDYIARYEHTSPELFTAILKNIGDTANYLTYYHSEVGNWRQFEYQSMLNTANKLPEFYDAQKSTTADGAEYGKVRCLISPRCPGCVWNFENWQQLAMDELESLLFTNTLPDGSYMEDTFGYNHNAYSSFVNYKTNVEADGYSVSDEYNELLHKAAYYNILSFRPDGWSLQYGDDQMRQRDTTAYAIVARLFNDIELEYINTYGQSGTKPSWLSKHFPDSTTTFMRANWTQNSPFLHTNVRGGGVHGHADDNSIIAYAYGRTLLNDAGVMSYTNGDPLRIWGLSTVAHNSVVINDGSQDNPTGISDGLVARGKVYDWATNASFDYLSQSTMQNQGFEHRRSIFFVKNPGFWIVSDLMIPQNTVSVNNYKQVWHMPPESNFGISQENKTMYSNYDSGANMIVASADAASAELRTAMGYYDKDYLQVQDVPYAYFEKEGAGNVKFDTVLFPYDGPSAGVKAEKLSTTANATALKVDFELNDANSTGYYYMSYNNQPGPFGKYSTDGQVAYVEEDSRGNVTYFMIMNGTYIKNDTTGKYLVKSPARLDEMAVNMAGSGIYITKGEADLLAVTIGAGKSVASVYVNEVNTAFEQTDDKDINNIGVGTPPAPPAGSAGGIDSKIKNGAAGTQGGGPSPSSPYEPPAPPASTPVPDSDTFPDVQGHWAAEYANNLKKKGIVFGDENGNFIPYNNITRAEFTAMVVRALGLEQSNRANVFADVSGSDWYYGVIQTALEYGLISPADNFYPNNFITRQEMAKIISMAAAASKRFDNIEIKPSNFNDEADIAAWAKEHVDFVYSAGLMNGMGDGSFKPLSNATRGEVAAVISRLLEN